MFLIKHILIRMATHTRDFSHELVAQNSQHIEKSICRDRVIPIQYYLNCWKLVKLTKPQRKHETRLGVKVTKVEKIS